MGLLGGFRGGFWRVRLVWGVDERFFVGLVVGLVWFESDTRRLLDGLWIRFIRAWSSGRGLVVGQGRCTARAAVDSNPVSLPSTTFQLPQLGLIAVDIDAQHTPTHPSQQVGGSNIIRASSENGRQPGFPPCYPKAITRWAPGQDANEERPGTCGRAPLSPAAEPEHQDLTRPIP